MNNYKYCAVKQICVPATVICNNKTNETEYTNVTGCPVVNKCDLGMDGNFFIDTGNAAMGGLDTSLDSSFIFKDLNTTNIAKNSSMFPCALVIYNLPSK